VDGGSLHPLLTHHFDRAASALAGIAAQATGLSEEDIESL
jgi:hypothetical protein